MAATTIKIKLESPFGTGYYYTTTKTRNCQEKIKIKKYDPIVRQHGDFVEKKIK